MSRSPLRFAGRRRAGGFTLLETVLAASLSALIVLMVIGMFAYMDRAEAKQVAKLEQISSMSRIHTVMQRTFSTLVVSDQNVQGLPPGAAGGVPGNRSQPNLDARLLLEADDSPTLKRASRRAGTSNGPVQHLIVVLDKPPVPRRFAEGMAGTLGSSVQANQEDTSQQVTGPVRGIFELRPDRATARVDGTSGQVLTGANGETGMTLWWRPLGSADDDTGSSSVDPMSIDPTDDPAAVPIAAGLAECNWKAFIKRVRQDEIRVVSYVDLPAYMEMEVRTVSGFYANWMFEVQWSVMQQNTIDQQRKRTQETNGRARPLPVIGGGR